MLLKSAHPIQPDPLVRHRVGPLWQLHWLTIGRCLPGCRCQTLAGGWKDEQKWIRAAQSLNLTAGQKQSILEARKEMLQMLQRWRALLLPHLGVLVKEPGHGRSPICTSRPELPAESTRRGSS